MHSMRRLFLLVLLLATVGLAKAGVKGAEESNTTVWTCSMHPQIQLPDPGQCPICFMDLIERKKKVTGTRFSLRQITLDQRARELARVEVRPVIRARKTSEIRMVGRVDYDETRVGTITSWINGRIDRLHVDYTGSQVRLGQPMADVYSPELFTAQAELIQARSALDRARRTGNEIIIRTSRRTWEASRKKLRLLGLSDEQIRAITKRGRPSDHVTLTAPMSGIVIKKDVNEGMYVKTGSPIYTIADLNRVWVILEAYESDLHALETGQEVRFSVESYPGTLFTGTIAYIDPLVDKRSRTVRVRLDVDNRQARLKPGMFVRATALPETDPGPPPLLIPASAPLITGKRALVYVQVPRQTGVYVGREVILGPRRGEFYQVKAGLKEGELVVVQGNFKIDSAIQIQAAPSMMSPYHPRPDLASPPLPSLFRSRLNLLNRAFADYSRAIHADLATETRQKLSELKKSLDAIQGKDLREEEKLAWQELRALLAGDLILLADASSRQETLDLYAELAEHMDGVRIRFGLDNTEAALIGSQELKKAIFTLVKGYLDLQQDLAADNPEKGQQHIARLTDLSDRVGTLLAQEGFERAQELERELNAAMTGLNRSTDLADMRTGFAPLSRILTDLVTTFGLGESMPLYLEFCPMAFDNTGATWLSRSPEINNPYFGAAMLRCGEVRQQLSQ